MLKKIFLTGCILLAAVAGFAQAGQGALKGKVVDLATGEPLPFVNVVLEMNGQQKGGSASDFDGNYVIKPIPPGTYDLKASFTGYKPIKITGIIVKGNKIAFADVKMESTVIDIKEFEVVEYAVPLIDKDNTSTGGTVTKEDIDKMPGRSATSVAQTIGGVYSQDNGKNDMNIRGARSDANYYYIDGVKVRGSNSIPKQAIEQVSVITGGVPAAYGDVTGGIVSITTRGPSSNYFGGLEYTTSGYKFGNKVIGLDHFGYNLLEFSLSGPLLMRKDSSGKKTDPILGFFLAGNLSHTVDASPSSIGLWKVKDDVLADINAAPLRFSTNGPGTFQNAEFLRLSDLEKIRTKENVARKGVSLSGKIDLTTSETTNLTVGGSMDINKRHLYDYNNTLLNTHNNAVEKRQTYRAYARFTQRFNAAGGTDEKSAGTVKNVYYSIQADYEQYHYNRYDDSFKDRFFDYGYYGKFKTYQTRYFQPGTDSLTQQFGYVQETFRDTLVWFIPDTIVNPEASMYTAQYYKLYGANVCPTCTEPNYDYDLAGTRGKYIVWGDNLGSMANNLWQDPYGGLTPFDSYTNIRTLGGLLNGDGPPSVYSVWNSPAAMNNRFDDYLINQFRISATGSADIKDHAISIGFEYEQRVDRDFIVIPRGLWTLGELYTNNQLQDLDRDNPTVYWIANNKTFTYERLNAAPGEYSGTDAQYFFDYNLRKALGLDPDGNDWIDFHSYGPEAYKLSYFSADELLNNGNSYVSYYGYDHTGNKLKKDPTFDDFFTAKDEYGNYTRPIAPFRPIYTAGYIQDKFAFDDLIFNIGIRIDRFDANQKVLKDPYVLFPTIKAGEDEAITLAGENGVPANVGSDWAVYVDNLTNPTSIVGYRDGDTWYNAEGAEITDPASLETPTGIAPLLVDKDHTNGQDVTSQAFEDYKPQTSFMPRIAFSFPISDEALFFAHYDILTKRPTTGARLDPTDYYFIQAIAGSTTLNNPNLKPEKTIDYELGFQQKLTNSSSLKISAFYRELRDMVQVVPRKGAFPTNYRTYGNIDFGTIKGLTIGYDLRRTGNIWIKAYYTLQFADGTGSDATTSLSLVRAGKENLRTTNALSYDQRHTIQITADYRFADGKDYNGPILMDKQILANTGVNFIFNAGSGTPYSAQSTVSGRGFLSPQSGLLKGRVNGSRLPWQARVDARIDKDLELTIGGTKEEGADESAPAKGGMPLQMNVYMEIFNVLNAANVISVYRATGNPDDDGYLQAAEFQNDISAANNEQSFRELYELKINNPGNYSLPRRIRLGVSVNF